MGLTTHFVMVADASCGLMKSFSRSDRQINCNSSTEMVRDLIRAGGCHSSKPCMSLELPSSKQQARAYPIHDYAKQGGLQHSGTSEHEQ